MRDSRRRFLGQLAGAGAVLAGNTTVSRLALADNASPAAGTNAIDWAGGTLQTLSDGQMSLPLSFILPDTIDATERAAFLEVQGILGDTISPDCNVTLWQGTDRVVLFDVGGGFQFMDGLGQLAERLSAIGVDPYAVTDVMLTHAHPDHLWGALDDFDDIAFPDAVWHINEVELDYWLADTTLDATPDARKAFVVGAQNRLSRLDEQLQTFRWGDEVLPGIEAVDTNGHTPGHTSFALHDGSESLMVLGDALTHAAISFQRPRWPSGSDQDPQAGIQTRLALLDRLAGEQMGIVGFHLPHPGRGHVESQQGAYRYVAS